MIFGTIRRGLVKWYDKGLQNLWWEFDSLIPCHDGKRICVSRLFIYFTPAADKSQTDMRK